MDRARFRRIMSSRTADWVVRASLVAVYAVVGVFAWQVQDLSACVARYNDANNARAEVLTQVTNEERTAERKADDAQAALFLSPAVSRPVEKRTPADQAEILRLFAAYQAALSDQQEERKAADDARRVHPIPDPPKDVCG